jgi:hypothetical protein
MAGQHIYYFSCELSGRLPFVYISFVCVLSDVHMHYSFRVPDCGCHTGKFGGNIQGYYKRDRHFQCHIEMKLLMIQPEYLQNMKECLEKNFHLSSTLLRKLCVYYANGFDTT